MSSKRKANSSRSSQVVEKIEKSGETMTFHAFFQSCLSKGSLRSWQEQEVQLFFKSQGLTDKETEDRYRDALRKY